MKMKKKISFINSGIYTFNIKLLLHYIDKLTNNNNQNEYYLTQIFELISRDNINIDYSIIKDIKEISGINTQEQLTILENYTINKIINNKIDKYILYNNNIYLNR